jgi:hypothetical protein
MPTTTGNDGYIWTLDAVLNQGVWSPPSAVAVGDTASYKGESSPTALEFSYLHFVTGPIQTQINSRAPLASPALTGTPTVNGTAFGTAAFKNTGTASGEIPLLGTGGKLPSSTLPALAITDTFVVASQAAMLALSAAETGDVAVRTDLNKSFILRGSNPAVLADWQELLTPTDTVISVNGQTGVVVLTTQHIGEHSSNLYHTPARVNALIAAQVGVTVQAYDAGLAALAAFNTNGLLVQTADNAFAGRTLTAPAAGFTITNPAGTAGNPTFALANDLAALEGLGSTGIAVRTAADTWAQRSVTVTASTGLAVTNGDGVAGNITLAGVDASTTVKGVASFNSTNFSVAAGAVNSIQNINTAATPTFAGLLASGTTFNLANATATTVNFAGAASALNVGAAAGTVTFAGSLLTPASAYATDIGQVTKKFKVLHAAELVVTTLVAESTQATIGGRILVGPTTSLIADLAAAGTTIDVKHNNLNSGDRLYMEGGGAVEFLAVTSSATVISGGYRYSVTRNLDGTGANQWYAGDAVFNSGTTGSGWIDLYSGQGVKGSSQPGPAIVGNVRNSSTYNDWSESWAVGNLKGLYGYGATTYGAAFGKYANGSTFTTVDAANGFRVVYRTGGADTVRAQVAADGSAFFGNNNLAISAGGTLTIGGWTINSATIAGTNATLAASGKLTLGSGADVLILDANDSIYRMYAGNSSPGVATFRLYKSGALEASNVTLTGSLGMTFGQLFGSFVVSTGGYICTGNVSGLLAGNGWYMDHNNGGQPRFRVGTVSGGALTAGLYWDGADLSIKAAALTVSGDATFDTNTLHVDSANNRVGVGTTSTTAGFALDVNTFARMRSGLVVGAELGGYVISGNHRIQVIATGTQSIAMFQGGSGVIEIWKDTTPTKAAAFGMAVPGNAITDDFIFSTFSSAAPPYWFERMRITNAGALKLAAYGAGTLRTDSSGSVTAAAAVSVTGSRGGNAALAGLLTQLASLGVIVDNTTA